MTRTVERRPAVQYETVENRATLGAALYLGSFVTIGLTVWGEVRGVALPIRNTIRLGVFVVGGGVATTCLLYRPGRCTWWRNVAFALAVGAAVLGVQALPPHAEIELREHEAELVAVA